MSSPGSSDSDLQRAIALSLEVEAPVTASREQSEVIVLSDSENEADVQIPMTSTDQAQAVASLTNEHGKSPGRPPVLRTEGYRYDGQRRILNQNFQADRESIASSPKPLLQEESSAKVDLEIILPAFKAMTSPPNIAKFGQLNRKQMEEERLARTRKRKATSSSSPLLSPTLIPSDQAQVTADLVSSRPNKRPTTHNAPAGRPPSSEGEFYYSVPAGVMDSKPLSLSECMPAVLGTPLFSPNIASTSRGTLPSALSYKEQVDLMKPGLHFPDGVVKKTWAQGYPRDNDIKIEEVLQKNDLEMAVLSAFQWDADWILGKLDMVKTRLICVMQAKTEEEKSQMRAGVPPRIRFCFPSMEGQINCMHSKLQLLAHPTHLRVVVPSANLVPYDWGEDGGIIENIVFIIDLPRIAIVTASEDTRISTPFQRELIYFLKAMEMDQNVIDSLVKFDFSRTAHLAFVHSIGGSHVGSAWKRTGYAGLGSAIRELGLARRQPINIDLVSASIGALTHDFIRSIYLAAQGDNGTTELDWRINRRPRVKAPNGKAILTQEEERVSKEVEGHFRIYFPSRDTIARSKGGIGAGGTICFQSKWYDTDRFPQSLMRDCKSQRPRMLMHNKMIFARPTIPLQGENNELYAGWAYVGSANLSESAWGRLVVDKSTKAPKMNLRNWECGVVVTVPLVDGKQEVCHREFDRNDEREKGKEANIESPTMEIFKGVVPVPMAVPGEMYGGKRPWFYAEA